MGFDFFFSYSTDTCESFTEPLYLELTNLGIKLWYDKMLVKLGDNIYINIERILEETKDWIGAIVIADRSYFEKPWCRKEIDYFIKNNIPMYLILFGITKDEIPLEYIMLKKFHRYTITKNDADENNKCLSKIIDIFLDNVDYQKSIDTKNMILNDLMNFYKNTPCMSETRIILANNLIVFYYQLCREKGIEVNKTFEIFKKISELNTKLYYSNQAYDLLVLKNTNKIIKKIFNIF